MCVESVVQVFETDYLEGNNWKINVNELFSTVKQKTLSHSRESFELEECIATNSV